MPTVFSHAAAPLAPGLGFGPAMVPRRLMAAGVVAAVVPDLDVVTFHFGIPYSAGLGHRGFSHSLVVAALVGLAGAAGHRLLGAGFVRAFFWHRSGERYWAPDALRVLEASPISLGRFLSARGLAREERLG